MIAVLLSRFLIGGLLAWVAAIVIGIGAFFELWSWRRHWTLAGALAGAGSFALYVAEYSMTVPSMGLVAGLFVGCGIAVSYGTLFLHTGSHRPILPEGSVEEHFWVRDAIDRLRPQRLDWILTAALLVPGAGLAWMGLRHLFNLAPIVIGVASWAGPLFAAAGLAIRHRASSGLIRELEEREPPGLGTGSEHA